MCMCDAAVAAHALVCACVCVLPPECHLHCVSFCACSHLRVLSRLGQTAMCPRPLHVHATVQSTERCPCVTRSPCISTLNQG